MHKLILALALSLAATLAQAGGLEGTWRSSDTTGGAAPGTLILGAKGKLTMQPDGFEALLGTWKKDGALLVFTIEGKGEAVVAYVVKADTLALQYSNGLRQAFQRKVRVTPKPDAGKAPGKKPN
jgi:hypothetical protein